MLGISADRLIGENLPVQTHYFVFAALILIAVYVVATLWFRRRLFQFSIPALLFVIFGMWASNAAVPQFPQVLEPYLDGRPASYIAEVSASTTIFNTARRVACRGFGQLSPRAIKH
jgi:hypothetical protein